MSVFFSDVLVYRRDAPGCVIGPTNVLVSGSRIAAIGELRPPEGARIIKGHGHHLLIPGLINAHFHSAANHLKGSLPSLPLELFMLFETPAASLRASPREAYLRTMLAALEMLRTGTTSVQDDAFLVPSPDVDVIDAVMQAYADCGIRACVALDQPELSKAEKLPYLGSDAPDERRNHIRKPGPIAAGRAAGDV